MCVGTNLDFLHHRVRRGARQTMIDSGGHVSSLQIAVPTKVPPWVKTSLRDQAEVFPSFSHPRISSFFMPWR